MPEMLASLRRGVARAERRLPADFHTSPTVTLLMRQPGEPLDPERILPESGAGVTRVFTTW